MDVLAFLVAVALAVVCGVMTVKHLKRRGFHVLLAWLLAVPASGLGFLVVMVPATIYFRNPEYVARQAANADAAERERLRAAADAAKVAERKVTADKAAADAAAAEKRATELASDRSSDASIFCRRQMTETLIAPSTADFPYLDERVWRLPNARYVIKSYVDAQNAFGAMVRTHWRCEVLYKGGRALDSTSWELVKLSEE